MKEKKFQKFRWRYFIDKPFQVRFIARFFILILLGLALSLGVIGVYKLKRFESPLFFKAKQIDTTKVDPTKPIKIEDTIDLNRPLNIFDIYSGPLVYISALYLILITIFGLFISHKMAGPVYRIKKTLDEASDGKIDLKTLEFKLRKKDELQDLVEALNRFLEKCPKK